MQMIAIKPLRYMSRVHMPGTVFAVPGMRDARLLVALGRARIHTEAAQPTALPAPQPPAQVLPPPVITIEVEDAPPAEPATEPAAEPEQPQLLPEEAKDADSAEPPKPRRAYRRRDITAEQD